MNDYCLTKGNRCEKDNNNSAYSCEFIRPYVQHELYYCNKEKGEWEKNKKITTAEQYCDGKIKFDHGYETCSYDAIAAVKKPDCEEGDAGCDKWESNVYDETCFVPSGLTWPEGVEPDGQPLVGYCGLYTEGWRWGNGV